AVHDRIAASPRRGWDSRKQEALTVPRDGERMERPTGRMLPGKNIALKKGMRRRVFECSVVAADIDGHQRAGTCRQRHSEEKQFPARPPARGPTSRHWRTVDIWPLPQPAPRTHPAVPYRWCRRATVRSVRPGPIDPGSALSPAAWAGGLRRAEG